MTKTKPIRLSLLALLFICALPPVPPAAAQDRAARLEAVSREMFAAGNSYFIIVEAFKDGFIKENERFHYKNSDSLILINGKAVPQPYQRRYLKLLADFKAAGQTRSGIGSLQCDGINMELVLDPKSSLRDRREEYAIDNATGIITNEMTAEGIADTTRYLKIEYNTSGIYVNGRRLEGKVAEKYEMRFLELGCPKPKPESTGLTFIRRN
jgi:hypothetical protein